MICDGLKRHRPDIMVVGEGKAMAVMPEDPMGVWCHIQDVRYILDEKYKEIARLNTEIKEAVKTMKSQDVEIMVLKQKLEEVQASAYADSVDAGMRERRLRRSLYKACANWAKCEERINNRDAYEASEYLPSAEDKFRRKAERWSEMERKCRAKVEEYK